MKQYWCDVLVIGGGGAGLMAANVAASQGNFVLLLNKGWIGHTGSTVMAPGAFAAVDKSWCSLGDSCGIHLEDTIRSGQQINNPELAKLVVDGSAGAAIYLESMGSCFDRDTSNGHIKLLRPDEGHSYNRAISFQRRIGQELLVTLRAAACANHVQLVDNVCVFHLLKSEDGDVCGAIGLDSIHLKTVIIQAKAVILATGGAGGLYLNSDAPLDITGDGMVLALQAGASLIDMEFIQFHPSGLISPISLRGLLGAHMSVVHLYNKDGERFMSRYDPISMERATRDVLSRSMAMEILDGRGSPLGGVYGSLKHNSIEQLYEKTPEYLRLYQRIGFDPKKDLLQLAPTAHYTMGGIRVDTLWQTEVPGLFAAGECCGGVHGANRLSQNALSEMLVSGRIAGYSASSYAAKAKKKNPDLRTKEALEEECRILLAQGSENGISPGQWRYYLQSAMNENVGVIRCREGLLNAMDRLDSLTQQPMRLSSSSHYMNGEIIQALENQRMLLLAYCVILSALIRRESRGAHTRIDYPEADPHYLRNHIVSLNTDGKPIVYASAVQEGRGGRNDGTS